MKRLLSAVALFLAILLLAPLGALAQPAPTPKRVRVGYFAFNSFHNTDDQGQRSGYGYEYLQEIAKYTDWEYEYVSGTWDQCLEMLEKGEIDLLGSAQKTADREQLFDYPKLESGVSYAILCINSANQELAYEDFEAFDGITVGLLEGNSRNANLDQYCQENGFSVRKVICPDEAALVEALHQGQVDAILTSNLRKGEQERIVARFAPSPFFFITTKGNREVLDGVNRAQSQIKMNNPAFDLQLYEKYYGVEATDRPVFTRAEQEYLAQNPVLQVLYSPAWAPIEYQDKGTGEFRGIGADVLDLVSQYTGIGFEYRPSDGLESAYQLLDQGQADLLCGYENSEALASAHRLNLTVSYLTFPYALVTKPQIADADSQVLAIAQDHLLDYQQVLKKNDQVSLRLYPTVVDCFEALGRGEVAALYANSYAINQMLSDTRYSHFTVSTLPSMTMQRCIAVPKSADPRLYTILNKTLACISSEQLNKMIIDNTAISASPSLVDIFYRNPLPVLGFGSLFFLLVIGVLFYILRLKSVSNRKIFDLLYRDSLTGAWNYNKFQLEAARLLKLSPTQPHVVIYTDIERFKYLNENYGYSQGDLVLKGMVKVLGDEIGQGETFARINADNFIALLRMDSRPALIARLAAINDRLNAIPRTDHKEYFRLTLCSGLYIMEPGDRDLTGAVDGANEARKSAKGSHKSSYAFFDEALNTLLTRQREMEEQMDRALAQGQFVAYYQPKYDLKTEQMSGAEALVRWVHPTRGMIAPFLFVPLFERNGFITEVDFAVFEQVCALLRSWLDRGWPPIMISSNFSRVHLRRPDFCRRLLDITQKYQVPTHLLELELTESAAEENTELLVSLFQELRSMGFSIAMDDFGSGYSSLTLLQKLPVNTLKLDKEFLQQGFVSERVRIIIEGFVHIAEKLHMDIVCEGVETTEQAAFLRDIGCGQAQGYLFAKPMPRQELEQLLPQLPKEPDQPGG